MKEHKPVTLTRLKAHPVTEGPWSLLKTGQTSVKSKDPNLGDVTVVKFKNTSAQPGSGWAHGIRVEARNGLNLTIYGNPNQLDDMLHQMKTDPKFTERVVATGDFRKDKHPPAAYLGDPPPVLDLKTEPSPAEKVYPGRKRSLDDLALLPTERRELEIRAAAGVARSRGVQRADGGGASTSPSILTDNSTSGGETA